MMAIVCNDRFLGNLQIRAVNPGVKFLTTSLFFAFLNRFTLGRRRIKRRGLR